MIASPSTTLSINSNNKFAVLPIDEVEISTIKFKRLGPEARRPEKKSKITAGYDISSVENKTIRPWKHKVISTQIVLTIPHGAYGRIVPHSRLALKGIDVTAGVIDSDYQGEVKVLLVNHSDVQFQVKTGDRIAQLIIEKISLDKLNKENNLDETKRGDQGFGSMGVAKTPKILILKRPKTKTAKAAESPCGILPEKVDKQPSHKKQLAKAAESPCVILPKRVDKWLNQKRTAESSKPMATAILPKKGDKQSRQGWMNTVDPWTSQWIKKVVNSNDEEHAIKHMRSFV